MSRLVFTAVPFCQCITGPVSLFCLSKTEKKETRLVNLPLLGDLSEI